MAMTIVNVVGGFLAGWIVVRLAVPESSDPLHASTNRRQLTEHWMVGGLIGGFTTISGYAWIVAWQVSNGAQGWHTAATVVLNGVVGVSAAGIGVWLGGRNRRGNRSGLP
jgi:fluoride ion exporter CrcB/FEX